MITAELTRKIDLLPQEAYHKVEQFVEQLAMRTRQDDKEKAFQIFMDKMDAAEKSMKDGFTRKRKWRKNWQTFWGEE